MLRTLQTTRHCPGRTGNGRRVGWTLPPLRAERMLVRDEGDGDGGARCSSTPSAPVSGGILRSSVRLWLTVACLSVLVLEPGRSGDVDAPPAPPAGRLIPDGVGETRYLCVFGPQGDPRYGATDSVQVLFFALPAVSSSPLAVHVYDPGSGGRLEFDTRQHTPVTTRFSVLGGEGTFSDPASRLARPKGEQRGAVLVSKTFGTEEHYRWVTLGRFGKQQGEQVGRKVYYKLVVVATEGGSANLYRVAVSPHTVDVFTYELSITVSRSLVLSVALPADVSTVQEHSFDLDSWTSRFLGDVKLTGSRNGRWVTNEVRLPSEVHGGGGRYRVERSWGGYDHMAFYLTDTEGRALPLRFSGE